MNLEKNEERILTRMRKKTRGCRGEGSGDGKAGGWTMMVLGFGPIKIAVVMLTPPPFLPFCFT